MSGTWRALGLACAALILQTAPGCGSDEDPSGLDTAPARIVASALKQSDRGDGDAELTGAALYRNGAVVDYRVSAEAGETSAVLLKRPDGRWRISRLRIGSGATVDTDGDADRRPADDAMYEYAVGVVTRDCGRLVKYVRSPRRSVKGACASMVSETDRMAYLLGINYGADIRYLGGNAVFRFYTLVFPEPKRDPTTYTVSTMDTADRGPLIIDAQPGPAKPAVPRSARTPRAARAQRSESLGR